MGQDAMKTLRSDVSFSDVRVPVPMGTERHLGIVRVDHFHVFDAQDAVSFSNRLLQPRLRRDIAACREQMAGVQAVTDLRDRSRTPRGRG